MQLSLTRIIQSGYTGTGKQRLEKLFTVLMVCLLLSPLESRSNDWAYTVRPGDNIWNITEKYLLKKEYADQLVKSNNIKNPGRLQPGSKLHIPVKWMKRQPASARVIHAQGEVTIIRSAAEQPKSVGNEINLYVGDIITTGANGSATLEFADKSRLLIQQNSELVMDTLSSYGDSGMVDTRLRLPAGRVETQVTPKKGPGSRYEITTPAATAAVRGTDFRVSADVAKPVSRSEVLEGKVNVNSTQSARDVPAGFGTVTESGKAPIPPKKLLPRPGTSQTTKLFKKIPMTFSWQAVAGAQAYRAQIYPAGKFDTLLLDRQLPSNEMHLDDLEDNHYTLRIRAIDELGLEGLNQDHAFSVDARPFAPVIISPTNNVLLRDGQPVLNWSATNPSERFHLQLAYDPSFKQIVIDLPVHQGKQFRPGSKLDSATFYWRVASLDNSNLAGPFSETGIFQVRPLPAIPEVTSVTFDRQIMKFTWKSSAGHLHYQLQMATDSAFENIVTNMNTKQTLLTFQRPPSDIYYYRLRAINQQGESSTFSNPTLIHVTPLNYNNQPSP